MQQVAAFKLEQREERQRRRANAKPETGQSNPKARNESRYNLPSKKRRVMLNSRATFLLNSHELGDSRGALQKL